MGLKFNPLTAQFDLTGSGGGASYIDGEVATYNDLPLSSTTAPLNSSWLVRTASGSWFTGGSKPAGIYVRINTAGSSRDNDYVYAGLLPSAFSDSELKIYDQGDSTKTAQFQLSGITAGQNRVLTVPDSSGTIALAGDAPAAHASSHYPAGSDPLDTGSFQSILGNNNLGEDINYLDGVVSGLGTAATADLNAISDADLRIVGSTDATKKIAIEVDTNVPTNTVVTLTAPSSGGTIARTSDIPSTFAASAITSGVFDNARINFAAPSAIGSTTPAAVSATDLSASSRLNIPNTNGTTAGDIYRNANTLRYRDSTNTERLLLNATDNLANLASAATSRTNLGVGSSDAVTFGSIQGTPIGSTTAAAITGTTGTFSTLSANNGTITASAPALTVSQTWNNSGVTFSALDINVTNTASFGDSALIKATIGGTTVFQFRRDYRLLLSPSGSDALIQAGGADWIVGRYNGTTSIAAPTIRFNTGNSTILEVGTADTMEMRRTTNPQTFRIYNTFTDASNYERGFMRWSSNVLQIGTEAGGTGSNRAIQFWTSGSQRWQIGTGGELSAANGLGISLSGIGGFNAGASGFLSINGNFYLRASSDGVVRITNWAETDFGRLQFGGTTSSFPALKRSSTTLQVRLADDSADAPLSCGALTVSGNITHTGSLTLASPSTNNIIFQTNSTTRWQIAGASGALQGNDAIPLRFGGNTASFPRLVNSGAVLQCSLADGSAYAVFEALFRAQGTAPATSGATGTAGDIRYDADYIYICTAANTWKRAAIATW